MHLHGGPLRVGELNPPSKTAASGYMSLYSANVQEGKAEEWNCQSSSVEEIGSG